MGTPKGKAGRHERVTINGIRFNVDDDGAGTVTVQSAENQIGRAQSQSVCLEIIRQLKESYDFRFTLTNGRVALQLTPASPPPTVKPVLTAEAVFHAARELANSAGKSEQFTALLEKDLAKPRDSWVERAGANDVADSTHLQVLAVLSRSGINVSDETSAAIRDTIDRGLKAGRGDSQHWGGH